MNKCKECNKLIWPWQQDYRYREIDGFDTIILETHKHQKCMYKCEPEDCI